jgi:cell division protein FtsL
MLTEKSDIKETEESALDENKPSAEEMSEQNLEKAIKEGLSAPYSKVLLRLLMTALVVAALAMFFTGIMKYNEFRRQAEVLEEQRDILNDEIDELKYLIDCPVDYDNIVRVAREKMNLHLPDEIVYYNDYKD